MGRRHWIRWVAVMAVPLFFAACAGTQQTATPDTDSAVTAASEPVAEEPLPQAEVVEIDEQKRIEAEALVQKRKKAEKAAFVNQDVHFGFDSATLSPEALTILSKKVSWLKKNPSASVTIEGHCDARGTREYNLALGDRRAKSVKRYLIDSGIPSARIATISYGEERPMANGSTESAFAQNRRAHFVVR